MKKLIIVGAGASGLMLASLIKKNNLDYDVLVLEKEEHVGKKILLTGNGKCNLSNKNIDAYCYNNKLAFDIAKSFDVENYFNDIGLVTTKDEQGRIYPFSNQANTVLDVLRKSIEGENVITSCFITRIVYQNNKYLLTDSKNNQYEADYLVMATGGKTYYKDCNSYNLASMLSHRVSSLRPSLIPLKVADNLASIENLRCKVKASLLENNNVVYQDSGEVLFKKDYLSGIVMFQLSSIINRNPYKKYVVELDLAPDLSEKELTSYIERFPSMTGLFNKMLNKYILSKAISNNIDDIVYAVKHLRFDILDTLDFKNGQVTAGGISVSELSENLESKVHKNLFFIGEIVDCDGICGGYNLHFAFASAYRVYNYLKDC